MQTTACSEFASVEPTLKRRRWRIRVGSIQNFVAPRVTTYIVPGNYMLLFKAQLDANFQVVRYLKPHLVGRHCLSTRVNYIG